MPLLWTPLRCDPSSGRSGIRPDRDHYGPSVVANKTKLIVVSVVLWSLPGTAFGLSTVVSGSPWVGAAASLLGIVAARAILRRAVAALTNDRFVVATDHAVDGRIEAIEVFWRPG